MQGPSGKTRYYPKNYTDSATITISDLVHYGQFIQSGSAKTLTIPTPRNILVGRECEFINTGSGNLTVACTSGFVAAVNNYTVPTKTKLVLECVETTPGTYKWSPILDPNATTLSTTSLGSVIAAATAKAVPVVADLIGVVDTEAANVIKKSTIAQIGSVILGADPLGGAIAALAAKASPIDADSIAICDSAATNDAKEVTLAELKTYMAIPAKAAGSDIDTGTDDAKFVTAKAIADSAISNVTAWATFDPTSLLAWTTATPAGMTISGLYRLIGGTAEFKVYIVSADPSNNGGKINTMAFPAAWQPKKTDMNYPILGLHRKDTAGANTPTTMAAWLDCTQAAAGDRKISFINAVVWADNEATQLMFSGSFEYEDNS